ncbi:MAG: pyridoxamine 5'-phosphate oxidase [Flavobacterium sp.]
MSDLSNYRKSYEKSQLMETSVPDLPLDLFKTWFDEAERADMAGEVNAMTISSIGLDGYPKSRIVLLKSFDDKGFTFFTNYNSEKGKAIAANPNVCLSFFWPELERQVIIKGRAEKTAPEVSEDYFNSRPEGSRLGAIISPQSEVIPSRHYLDEKLEQEHSLQRPEHWGGYVVKPVEIEFWQGRANRLHDRIRYKLTVGGIWQRDRLAP